MALFQRNSRADKLNTLRRESRGQLSIELWNRDADHSSYVAAGERLLVEYATLSLETRSKTPLAREISGVMNKFLPTFVPRSQQVPPLADTATTAYILSAAESWAELDPAELARLGSGAWACFQEDEPESSHDRFRGGTLLGGLIRSHETHPEEKRIRGFEEFGRYVTGQPSYHRLLALEESFCTADLRVFMDLDAQLTEEYRWNNIRAWHIGVSTWVLDETGLLGR